MQIPSPATACVHTYHKELLKLPRQNTHLKGRRFEQTLHREDIQMANKISSWKDASCHPFGKCKLNHGKPHHTHEKMVELENDDNTELKRIWNWACQMNVKAFWQIVALSSEVKHTLHRFYHCNPRETKHMSTQRRVCVWMFTAALLTAAKNGKEPKGPPTGVCIN